MADVVSLDGYRIKRALKKGQKNGPLDMVALYVEFLLQKQLYQMELAKSKEAEQGGPNK